MVLNSIRGRIVRVDKESCRVLLESAEGQPGEQVVAAATDGVRWKGLMAPAVGDWVIIDDSNPGAEPCLLEILPRQNALQRKDPGQLAQQQVIAANIDIVALVHGLDQKLNIARLERGLVLAADSGAAAQVIFTKSDLAKPAYIKECAKKAQLLLAENPLIITSTRTGRGIKEIARILKGGLTMVLLGASGAGKSSLINALIYSYTQKTAEVRATDARGRHSTVARSLIALPGGGCIIDTPGIRALGLEDMGEGLDAAFSEIAELAQGCKFRDCSHLTEPDCAVMQAVENEKLSSERLSRYQRLKAETQEAAKSKEEVERKKRR